MKRFFLLAAAGLMTLSALAQPQLRKDNIDEVLNRLLLEIDFKGNCSRKKEEYLEMFKDIRPKYARR